MSWFSKAWRSVRKTAGKIVRSPIVKVAATGLAIVCPPAGAGTMAALAAADKVIAIADGLDPESKGKAKLPASKAPMKAEAKKVILATLKNADSGDAHSRHGAMMLGLASRRHRMSKALAVDHARRRRA